MQMGYHIRLNPTKMLEHLNLNGVWRDPGPDPESQNVKVQALSLPLDLLG